MTTETKPEVHSAAKVHFTLAKMAFDRMKIQEGTHITIPTEDFLIAHIANMLAILASPSAYEELWRRVREAEEKS